MALRPKIVKLAKMVGGLTGMMNHIDEDAPEYYALECVVSDEHFSWDCVRSGQLSMWRKNAASPWRKPEKS